MNQEILLQFYCKQLGVKTDRSPVAHPEIAGEGIEFDWGCSKLSYRAHPLSAKQNKTKFHELVNTVLGETILSLSLVRSNARRARQYMLAYAAIESTRDKKTHATTQEMDSTNKQPIDTVKLKSECKVIYSLIEKCVDIFQKQRTHCNNIEFDKKYLILEFYIC